MSLIQIVTIVAAFGLSGRMSLFMVDDDLAEPIRRWWRAAWIWILGPANKLVLPRTGKLWRFIGCLRCAGFWISIGVFALAWWSHGAAWFLYPALAASANMAWIMILERPRLTAVR